MNVTFCQYCGKHIVFIQTQNGKKLPCNAYPVEYWPVKGGSKRVVTKDGRVVAAELEGIPGVDGLTGYIPHFGECIARQPNK